MNIVYIYYRTINFKQKMVIMHIHVTQHLLFSISPFVINSEPKTAVVFHIISGGMENGEFIFTM